MKAHFNFDPMKDRLLPCKEAGLPFNDGDILEIVSTDDSNWWQVVFFIFLNPFSVRGEITIRALT